MINIGLRKHIRFFLVICIFTVTSCQSMDIITQNITPVPTTDPQVVEQINATLGNITSVQSALTPEMVDAQLEFNVKMLKGINELDENLFFSAMSVGNALAMLYFGAAGDTRREIANVLCVPDMGDEDIAAAQKAMVQSYTDSIFLSANSSWIDDSLPVKQLYKDSMLNVFNADVRNIDFGGAAAAPAINSWVLDKTGGMIDKLVDESPGALDGTKLATINALYFNGSWTYPFDPNKTIMVPFNGTNAVQEVPMMIMYDYRAQGYVADHYLSLKLPYGDDERFAMILVLPDDDIELFVNSMDSKSLKMILNTFEEQRDTRIWVPKFTMELDMELKDILIGLGMPSAFSANADFSGIADSELYVTKAVQKSKIDINEFGTEASMVTMFGHQTGEPENEFVFHADRPFLYFIYDTQQQLILFTGKVCNLP